MTTSDLHVDLFKSNPLSSEPPRFLKRLALDDPAMRRPDGGPTMLAEGWATYAFVSEPHTMADCPVLG